MWNKDEVKGKAEQAKGVVKEKAGQMTNDPDLEAEGAVDEASGKAREVIGTGKRKIADAADQVRRKANS